MALSSTWLVLWVGLLCSGGLIDAFNRNRKSTDGDKNGTQTSRQNNQPLFAQIMDSLFDEEQTDEVQTRSKRTTYPDNINRFLIFLSPDEKRGSYDSLMSASQMSRAPNYFLAGYPPFPPFYVGINTLYFPIPFCFPPFPFIPSTDEEESDSDETLTFPNRFNFPTSPDNAVNGQPDIKPSVNPTGKVPKVDFSVYYNTITGVDLNPVKPLRPPSITVPPAHHSMDSNSNDSSNGSKRSGSNVPAPKAIHPLTTERPDYKIVTAGTLEDESLQGLENAIKECCKPKSEPNCFDRRGFHFVDENPCDMQ